MATFIERVMRLEDWETDGGELDIEMLEDFLNLYDRGLVTASAIKSHFNMTAGQGTQFDALLATMPDSGLTLTVLGVGLALTPNALARARWVRDVFTALRLGLRKTHAPYDTAAEIEALLGI